MSRWVDADALAHIIASNGDADFINKVTKLMIDAPSIDIVRCKECNNYFYDKLNDAWFCRIHEYGEEFKPDDYCSYGERRANES